MSTSSPTLVQTLIGAIPAQEGAALVAQVGEHARITSAAGSVEVGSVALTADAIDDLSAQLLSPAQLETLRETGSVHGNFTASGAGEFVLLAVSTDDERRLEVRRRSRSTTAGVSQAASVGPPSEETLFAELVSRSFSHDAKAPASATGMPSVQPAAAAPIAPAPAQPVQAEIPTTPATDAAPPESHDQTHGTNDDLDVPANFEFPNSTLDGDDLTLPGALLDKPATAPSAIAPSRPQTATPAAAATHSRDTRTLSDRLRAYGRLSILLPALVLLVIGLPVAGWFAWPNHTFQPFARPVAAAPPPRPLLRSRPIAAKATLPVATGAAATPAVRSNEPLVAGSEPSKDAPAPPRPIPTVSAPAALQQPAALAITANGPARIGFSVQVAAVHTRDEADRMAAKLVKQGYSGYVVMGDGAAADFYRVRIGAFPDRQAAEDVAKQIERADGTKPWIVKETR
jgi:cell division septation protein DedD